MADVDTSSYQNKVLPLNPLDTYGKAATLQGTLNQNKLFQQQFQTNKAVSRIYKEAMNPDGTIDQAKLSALLSSDPDASYGLPQAYQASQEARQRNIQIDTSQLENTRKHLEALSGYLAPIVKPGATSAEVSHALAHAVTNRVANTDEAYRIWSTLPRNPQTGQIDESQIPIWAQQQQLNVMSVQERINAMSPAPQMVNTGQSQIPMRLPQIGEPSQAGPAIQNQLPPTTQVFDSQNNQMRFVGPQGGGGMPAGPGMGGGAPGGGMAAAPPLGAPEAAATSATFSANQGNTLQGRADRVMDNKAILGNLEGELGDFTTGPGTETIAKFNKLVNAQVGTNINVRGLASREQFNKLAGMLAQSQFQALGGTGTDAKLDATTLTSPNSELSKLGNKGIIALLKGNEDAISAKNQAWQAWQQQHGPQSYGQFQTEFNKSYDPRVFQSQYLSPEDRKKMLSGMTQQEKNQLFQSAQFARQNGWLK